MECFILAGGQSRRFGEDKLLYKINSVRTIDYVIGVAKEVCSEVYIVTKDKTKFKDTDAQVVVDLLPDQAPVIGIYTALKESQSEKILILSGDTPLIKRGVLDILIEEYQEPITIFSIKGKLHPLIGMYLRAVLPKLEEYLKIGGRSVIGFIDNIKYKAVTEDKLQDVDPELLSFLNMNTKEDLSLILEKIR